MSAEPRPVSEGPRGLAISPEAFSFLLFGVLSLSAIAWFSGYYVLFLAILAIDGLATLANSDRTLEVDRSTFFLLLLILSVAQGPRDLLFLFLEVRARRRRARLLIPPTEGPRHGRRPGGSHQQAPVLRLHGVTGVPPVIRSHIHILPRVRRRPPGPPASPGGVCHGGALRHLRRIQVPLVTGRPG